MRALLAAAAVAIAGCAGRVEIPKEVRIPVAVACVDQDAAAELEAACPALRSDAEVLALDDYKVIHALRVDRQRAAGCIAALKPALELCAKVPAAPKTSSGGDRRD